MIGRIAVVAVVLGSTGCAFDEGEGFARLSAALQPSFAGWEASGRVVDEGAYRTNRSFDLSLSKLTLTVDELRVYGPAQQTTVAQDGCPFDPANPPAACTLCHQGHCHCDGALLDYEEVEARYCSDSAASSAIELARMPVASTFDFVSDPHQRLDLTTCTPSCELPRGSVDKVAVVVGALTVEGTVRDAGGDRLDGTTVPLTVQLPWSGPALSAALPAAVTIDRTTPYRLPLEVGLTLPAELFDDIGWHELDTSAEGIFVDDTHNATTASALTERLANMTVEVTASGRSTEDAAQ